MREKLHTIDELFTCRKPPLDAETDNCSCPFRQIFTGIIIVFVARQAGIIDPAHLRMPFKPDGDLLGIFHMARHPDMERLEPLQKLKGIERREACAHVPQYAYAHSDDIGNASYRLPDLHPVIGWFRIGEFRKFAVVPREGAAIDYSTTNADTMAADEFRK